MTHPQPPVENKPHLFRWAGAWRCLVVHKNPDFDLIWVSHDKTAEGAYRRIHPYEAPPIARRA